MADIDELRKLISLVDVIIGKEKGMMVNMPTGEGLLLGYLASDWIEQQAG